MPTIQSKKYPDNQQFIDAGAWKLMQEKGLARRFKVIDDGDLRETVIPAPQSIVDFDDPNKINSPVDNTVKNIDDVVPEMARQDIKDWLDEKEIEYNTRASTKNLYKLYVENNK